MDQRSHERPTGHRGQGQRHRAEPGLVEIVCGGGSGEHATGDAGRLLVQGHLSFRLAGDGRLLVRCAGDGRVRGTPPVRVELAVEDADLEFGGALEVVVPPDARRLHDAFDDDLWAQRAERRDDGLVGLGARAAGRDLAVGPPVEEEARQRRVLRVLGSGPPQHRLVAGAGQGDVEQTEALALLLCLLQFPVGRQVRARTPDVDGSLVRRVEVVKDRDVDPKRPAVPGVRDHHDRELQSLASVNRDHLHRLRVRLQSTCALFVLAVAVCLQDASPQPVGEGRGAHTLGDGRVVQQLGDMTQVRHEPFPRRAAQRSSRNVAGGRDRLVERGDTSVTQESTPGVQPSVEILPALHVLLVRHLLRRPPDELRHGCQRRPGARCRLLERLEKAEPFTSRP